METGVTGGKQWFRAKARKSLRGNLGKHIMGEIRPVTAGLDSDDEVAKKAPQVWLDSEGPIEKSHAAWNLEKAIDRLDFVRKLEVNHGRGRPTPGVFEFVAGGIRSDTEGPERVAWATATVKWLEEGLGSGSTIALAVLHNDETTPHIHVMALVADENSKLGFTRVRDRLAGRPTKDHWDCGEALQDAYHENVSKHFNIERGERGTRKKRKEVDRAKAFKVFETRTKFRAQQKVDAAAEREKAAEEREKSAAERESAAEAREKSAGEREKAASAEAESHRVASQEALAARSAADEREKAAGEKFRAAVQAAEAAAAREKDVDAKIEAAETSIGARFTEVVERERKAGEEDDRLKKEKSRIIGREKSVANRESAIEPREEEINRRDDDSLRAAKEIEDREKEIVGLAQMLSEAAEKSEKTWNHLQGAKSKAEEEVRKLRDGIADDLQKYGNQRNVNWDLHEDIRLMREQAARGEPVVGRKTPERIEVENESDDRRELLDKMAGKRSRPRRNPPAAPPVGDVSEFVRERVAPIDAELEKIEEVVVPAPVRPPSPAKLPPSRGGRDR